MNRAIAALVTCTVAVMFAARNGRANVISVSSGRQLTAAIKAAKPGDSIVMKSGTWADQKVLFKGSGTADNPITLRAAALGKVVLTGRSSLRIEGEYLVVEGLRFDKARVGPRGALVALIGHRLRLTQCAVSDCTGNAKWLYVRGMGCRVDHCAFTGKITRDVVVQVDAGPDIGHNRLDHNLFADRPYIDVVPVETIRVGMSTQGMYDSNVVIEDNLFERASGEVEIISHKACRGTIRRNTFRNCLGTITLRQGHHTLVEGNVFLGEGHRKSGGVRVIGSGHTVTGNWFEGLRQGVIVHQGKPDDPKRIAEKRTPSHYPRVDGARIAGNTFVDVTGPCVELGKTHNHGGRPLRPKNITVEKNLCVGQGPILVGADKVDGLTQSGNRVCQSLVGLKRPPSLTRAHVGPEWMRSAYRDTLKPLVSRNGPVKKLAVADTLWANTGTIAFEFKLSAAAVSKGAALLDCPVLKLHLRGNSIWPHVSAAPTPKGQRPERVQFAFFKPGQWYHLAVAWDGPEQTLQLYLNGQSQQRAFVGRWTRSRFSGPLTPGGKNVQVRNVKLLRAFADRYVAEILVEGLKLKPLAGEGRTLHTGRLDLGGRTVKLIYEADFRKKQKIVREEDLFDGGKRVSEPKDADWVLEGRAKAAIEDGAMVVTSSASGQSLQNHAVLWNTREFPKDFLLEFEMTPKNPADGLAIVFFAATARQGGGSVFSPGLPKREADFRRYFAGALNCYHTSYWASDEAVGGSRLTTNLRKNHGFRLVALGDENIGAIGAAIGNEAAAPNRVRLLKMGGHIELETRGRRVLVWDDDGKHGPVWQAGQIGLRHMGSARQVRYHSFKVYQVK